MPQALEQQYRILAPLGVGGMGAVYLAVDQASGQRVALKLLRPAHPPDPFAQERFQREAHVLASLHHPQIVRLAACGWVGATPYLAMEYVPGPNLKTLLRRQGPLAEATALRLTSQVAAALAASHDQGVIHGDVKPSNILLDAGGNVKLIDFGIAHLTRGPALRDSREVFGSPPYLAPEQAQGAPAGERTDLYSLGMVLYELLTGQVPFAGSSPTAIARWQLSAPPRPPRTLRPTLSRGAEALVLKLLAADPARRPPDAKTLHRDLARLRRGPALDPFTQGTAWAA
jgi:serine/threonine protein kinase